MDRRKQILGTLSQEIAEKWNITQHKNKPIALYENQKPHCLKHKSHFMCPEEYEYAMASLEDIVGNPDYVFYDEKKSSIEFYKKLNDNVLVAVRTSDSPELKMRTIFPVKESKIENRKKKELANA